MGSTPLTIREASKALGLSEYTVRAWVASRRIGFVRLGRAIRIVPTEIERLIESGTVPAQTQAVEHQEVRA